MANTQMDSPLATMHSPSQMNPNDSMDDDLKLAMQLYEEEMAAARQWNLTTEGIAAQEMAAARMMADLDEEDCDEDTKLARQLAREEMQSVYNLQRANDEALMRELKKFQGAEEGDEGEDPVIDVEALDYEQLIAIEDANGGVSKGLAEEKAKELPEMLYKDSGEEEVKCCICQVEFEGEDKVTQLPCRHASFHSDCLQDWLKYSKQCPICKTEC